MNYSQTLGASTGQEFLQKLDETEKESNTKNILNLYFLSKKYIYIRFLVYRAGQESALHFRQWRDRSIRQIKTIDINSRSQS